jgi:N4-gp56 family major capsid protein
MASDFATDFTGTAVYDDVIYAAIITDMVLDALMAAVVTPPLLQHHDLAGDASKAYKFPKADKFTAAGVAEGTELLNTALTTTSVTITAAEVGIQATVTDVLEVSDIPAAHGARLRQLGRAMADKLDVDICALFAGFSNAVGGTGVNLSVANILDAIFTLENADAASLGQIVGVLHPRQAADIREAIDAESGQAYSGVAGARAAQLGPAPGPGFFGAWLGIPFWMSTNVPTVALGADRSGAIFIADYALAMVSKWAARVETMRWPPIRGLVLTASAMYGVGEVEDLAGVEVATDA